MSENCNQNCNTCNAECTDRTAEKPDFSAKPHELSKIKKVIGIVSGKGGVGKSLVTSMLAVVMKRRGYNTAILDADITGPSIPKAFGITTKPAGSELGLLPVKSETGIEIMSVNLLLNEETDPVIWRGSGYRRRGEAVLDGRHLARCRLHVYRYAPGNGRRAAYGIPVVSGRRHYYRNLAAGACRDDSLQSGKNGGNHEHPPSSGLSK
jgi:hypothetical protein